MSNTTDNPPAFPKTGYCSPENDVMYDSIDQCGMTLRDYFAGRAMHGLIAAADRNDVDSYRKRFKSQSEVSLHIARLAYGFADAMLAARAESAALASTKGGK